MISSAGQGRCASCWSGIRAGGALAVLLAARRTDVAGLVTVAANLDLAYWTARDGLAPLSGSLDPAAQAGAVAGIAQLHLAGERDEVVGADVVRAFSNRQLPTATPRLKVIAGFDHVCCWAGKWKELLALPAMQRVIGTDHATQDPGTPAQSR